MTDDMEDEVIWKPVLGYEGYYSVSNTGLVRSEDRTIYTRGFPYVRKGEIMKPFDKVGQNQKYKRVNLRRDAGRITKYVHTLVLEAFVGPKPEGMEACHFPDADPSNNNLSNLRWGTRRDNSDDRLFHNKFKTKTAPSKAFMAARLRGSECHMTKLTEEQVLEARKASQDLQWGDLGKMAKRLSISTATLRSAIIGKTWSHLPGATKTCYENSTTRKKAL